MTQEGDLLQRIAEARRRGEKLPAKPPPPRPQGGSWTLENWFDVDTGECSWHWVGMPSPEEVEKALGQLDCEDRNDDRVVETRRSATSQRERPKSDLLLTKDAVEYCNVSRSQFFEWVRCGYVKKIKIGRWVRYSIKSLDEMLQKFEQNNARVPRHKRRMRRNVLR